ncbi:MAG: alpha-2,8-polysialyltransferase family protein [Oscillospiraceae bacterium]|nr:alpha-2,8-polysialyltransferase family protein [Oscillospiraceae bacterium]
MKEALFICYTKFHVIIAVILKQTKFKNDDVDIIITDNQPDSENLSEGLIRCGLFGEVYHVKLRDFNNYQPKSLYDFKCYFTRIMAEINIKSFSSIININSSYNQLFTFSHDHFVQYVYYILQKLNPAVKVCLFDDGVAAYTFYKNKLSPISCNLNKLRTFLQLFHRRKYTYNAASEIYLLEPELLCWTPRQEIFKINAPDIDDSNFKLLINQIFDYDSADSYDEKAIFFEDNYFARHRPINDIEMVNNIADKIGKENLIVKLHPRSRIDRFRELGYKTNNYVGMPWELIAMNIKDDKKLLITYSSSSVLSYKILFNRNFKTIMLFKCMCMKEKNSLVNRYSAVAAYFEKCKKKFPDNFYIPETISELESLLESLI